MSTKFEKLLDYLVNEEMDKANELFHEIVVEKSRQIYENLIAEEEEDDEEMDESRKEDDEEMDESMEDDEEMDESMEDDEEMDEAEDLEDSYMMDSDDEGGFRGGDKHDPTDKLGLDVAADDDMGGDMGGEESEHDQAIYDIQKAIDELEAAFSELKASHGEEGDEDEMGDEFADSEGEEGDLMMGLGEGRKLREYTEKVGNDWDKSGTQKTDGDYAGAGSGETQSKPVAGKSPVSSGKGKITTSATAENILGDSGTGKGKNVGTSPDSLNKGIAQVSGEKFARGMHNVDGVKSGVKTLNKQGAGYPGNNKTAGPVGSGSGDKAGQTSVHNTPSPLTGAPGHGKR